MNLSFVIEYFIAAFKKELKIRNKAADGPSSPCVLQRRRKEENNSLTNDNKQEDTCNEESAYVIINYTYDTHIPKTGHPLPIH